jgi:hypothetical protein
MPFRDMLIECGDDTLAERYENTMSRLEGITQVGYWVGVQCDESSSSPKTRRWKED